MRSASLVIALVLAACEVPPETDAPEAPARTVAFGEACDISNNQAILAVEGYVDLFPSFMPCSGDGDDRRCELDFWATVRPLDETAPDSTASDSTVVDESLPLMVREGTGANEVDPTGYGPLSPVSLTTSDGTLVDPFDRVRITGRFSAMVSPAGGDALVCSFSEVREVTVAASATPTWRESAPDNASELDALIDSLNADADREEVE